MGGWPIKAADRLNSDEVAVEQNGSGRFANQNRRQIER